MTIPHILRIERLAALLVGLTTLLSLLFWDASITLGAAVGGAIAALNFYALRRLVQAITSSENQSKQAVMVILLTMKLGALAGAIYLMINYLPVNPLAFMVGVSVIVLSIFIEGFRTVLAGAAPQSE